MKRQTVVLGLSVLLLLQVSAVLWRDSVQYLRQIPVEQARPVPQKQAVGVCQTPLSELPMEDWYAPECQPEPEVETETEPEVWTEEEYPMHPWL